MPVILDGGTSGLLAEVGLVAASGLHTIAKANGPSVLGHYRIAMASAIVPAVVAGGDVLFSAQWSEGTERIAIITFFKARLLALTLFTAGTLTLASSFVFARGTGLVNSGVSANLTGNNCKLRASYPSTKMTAIKITGPDVFAGATLANQSRNIRVANRVNPAAGTEETIQPTSNDVVVSYNVKNADYPLLLTNGSLVANLVNQTAWPAAGSAVLQVEMAWSEVGFY